MCVNNNNSGNCQDNDCQSVSSWTTTNASDHSPIMSPQISCEENKNNFPVYQHPECFCYEHQEEWITHNYYDSLFGNITAISEDEKFVIMFIEKIFKTQNLSLDDLEEISQFIQKNKEKINQQNIIYVGLDASITMIGDIHGALDAMFFQLFISGGFDNNHKFLFLGDYLDRGPNGIECLYLLFLMRYLFPSQVYFLRGNHEDTKVCFMGGTMKELCKKGSETKSSNPTKEFETFSYIKKIEDLFTLMPIAANVGGLIFACHGCPSEYTSYEMIYLLNKEDYKELPPKNKTSTHIASNLVWSDPSDSLDETSVPNSRGEGFEVPQYITHQFLKTNNFSLIVRAHQCVEEGYHFQHDDKVLTLFGQPNYCGLRCNYAAYMTIEPSGRTEIVQFMESNVESVNEEMEKLENKDDGIDQEKKDISEKRPPSPTTNHCLPDYFKE